MYRASLPLLLCIVFAGVAAATPLTDWNSGATMIADPVDAGIDSGQDIVAAYHKYDGGFHYFRMDLAAAPGADNFAGVYGVWIDNTAGGAGANDAYTPGNPGGVDFVIDSHSFTGSLLHGDQHYHVWNGGGWTFQAVDDFQATENSGATVEFKVADTTIGSTIGTWCVSTYDLGSEIGTYDTACVPEPMTMVTLLASLGAVGMRVRRKTKA